MSDMTTSRLSIDGTGTSALRASGVIDAHTAPALEQALADSGADNALTLELREVDFIDSSGLRVIVAAHQRLADADRRLVLAGPSEAVERLFEITGLKEHLNVES